MWMTQANWANCCWSRCARLGGRRCPQVGRCRARPSLLSGPAPHFRRRRSGRSGVGGAVGPGVFRLMDELAGVPAVLLSQNADVLAANKAARAILPNFNAMSAEYRRVVIEQELAVCGPGPAPAAGRPCRSPDAPRIATPRTTARSGWSGSSTGDWTTTLSRAPVWPAQQSGGSTSACRRTWSCSACSAVFRNRQRVAGQLHGRGRQ
jgi:hypothetical protein